MSTPIGPNVRRLIAHKMSLLAIPPGSGDESFAMGIETLLDRDRFTTTAHEAEVWVRHALAAVRNAPDSLFTSDEEIAGEILKQINKPMITEL